jgi:hypothetical protein
MKRCPYCVEKMQDVAVVCPHCGRDYPLTESEDRIAVLATVNTDTSVRYLLAGIIIMLLILSGWAYWFYSSRVFAAQQAVLNMEIATQRARLTLASTQAIVRNESTSIGNPTPMVVITYDPELAMKTTAQATQISGLKAEIASLQNSSQRMCQGYGAETFDYTNNETLFAQLKKYAKNLGGEITKATYILPWNDPAIAIYTINTEISKKPYTFIFIGYFKSEKLNLTNAIYWIGNDCYLDRQ